MSQNKIDAICAQLMLCEMAFSSEKVLDAPPAAFEKWMW